MVDKHDFSGENVIFNVTVTTVLLSIFLHGLTAVPGANVYASTLDSKSDEKRAAEIKQVPYLPTRRAHKN